MKLPFLDPANPNFPHHVENIDPEYSILFGRKNYIFARRLFSFLLNLPAFSRLIIRLLLNGYRPQIRQGCDREQNCYWYTYDPLSGISKILASEAEIKQWLELMTEI